MHSFDVVMVGAGAAGLFCAGVAGQLGLKVLLIDHSEKVAEKIRISGGGRANFTNRDLDPAAPHKHFVGNNPHFCRSALSRYTPQDFTELLDSHAVAWHEKHKGQLFCNRSAEDLITALLAECGKGAVTRWQPCSVKQIRTTTGADGARYEVDSSAGTIRTRSLVIASGGLSIPKIGASDLGYRVARQFDLRLVEPRPALVPLSFEGPSWLPYSTLSGLSLPVQIATGSKKFSVTFLEDLLFTHRGLSGPAALQISSYWHDPSPIRINLAPQAEVLEVLLYAKSHSRKLLVNELTELVPSRLAQAWVGQNADWQRPINEITDKSLAGLAQLISQLELTPSGTEGYKKAEVTAGGVDTRDLSSQSMESSQAGLYFIGEVVDVTGWLGGYNFQWAWASAYACAQHLASS